MERHEIKRESQEPQSSSSGGVATRVPFLTGAGRPPQTKTWGLDRGVAAARKGPRELRLRLWGTGKDQLDG